MLTPNPTDRPSIQEILNILNNWEKIDKIELNVINPNPKTSPKPNPKPSLKPSPKPSLKPDLIKKGWGLDDKIKNIKSIRIN